MLFLTQVKRRRKKLKKKCVKVVISCLDKVLNEHSLRVLIWELEFITHLWQWRNACIWGHGLLRIPPDCSWRGSVETCPDNRTGDGNDNWMCLNHIDVRSRENLLFYLDASWFCHWSGKPTCLKWKHDCAKDNAENICDNSSDASCPHLLFEILSS